MDHEIQMEESWNDRKAQHFRFPFCGEDDLPKREFHRANSLDSDYSSYGTNSSTSSPAKSDSYGSSDEGLGLSIPHSSPSKLQQDNCHHANQIPVAQISSEIKSTDDKGQETAEAAEGPLIITSPIEDDHPSATVKLFPKPDHSLSIPIVLESSFKKVEIEQMLYPPYMTFGSNGTQITMSTAIDLLNRYCASLSSDRFRLRPVWDEDDEDVIYPEEADAEWLEKLYCKIKPMTPFKRLYRRRFFLPPNSPLREEVVGDFLPYERWAKRAAAYIACIKLHKLGELGDDLRPVTKVDPLKDQLMADEHDEELSGKGKQCCHKKTSDMKRMEALGDSLLKLATSIFVYGQSTRSRKCTEDWLLSLRMRQICDRNLNRLGKNPELGSTIIDAEFGLKTNYLPPCVTLVAEQNNKRLYQMASDKNTACCVKALAGASLLTSRMAGAMKFLERIGLETTPEGLENNVDPVNGFPRLENCVRLPIPMNGEDELNYLDLCFELEELEAKIKYRFNDKTLLIEALTHPTCYTNRLTVSYQRLAFLGDAVLDYLVTRSYFDDERKFSPADLVDLRSATVKNETFGAMAARHDFKPFLKFESDNLEYWLDKFQLIQTRYDHQIPDDYVLVHYGTLVVGADIAFDVQAPKALSDVFKSVAGAIFIDSDMSLEAVWKSYYPFLHEQMDKFRCNIPKSPIRLLHEKYPDSVFKKKKDLPGRRVCVAVEIEGNSFLGAGFNSKAAKRAAAKYALRDFATCK